MPGDWRAKEVCSMITSSIYEEQHNRIIMIEDLNTAVMEGLNSAFIMNPEMFAEHLNKSHYGSSTYEDPEPASWNFRSEEKSYISLRWFRPINKIDAIPMNSAARRDLLERGHTEWQHSGNDPLNESSKAHPRIHSFWRRTNIIRQERPLSATPEPLDQTSILASLEERATVYRTTVDENCFGMYQYFNSGHTSSLSEH
jgi:hypothetical protein